MLGPIDINALRLDPGSLSGGPTRVFKRQRHGSFLKGPIPLAWLKAAASLPGQALHVAIVIWWLHGLNRSYSVRLTRTALGDFSVERLSAYRGLKALEKLGLIAVERHRGRCPIITILDSPE